MPTMYASAYQRITIGPSETATGLNTGKSISRNGIVRLGAQVLGSRSRGAGLALRSWGSACEVAVIEREQPLPVAFGGVAVIDRALGEGKAVMRAGIDLDLVARSLHALLHLLDDFLRRVDIGLGAGEIEFGFGLLRGKVRAVGLVGRQVRAVDRGGRLDAVGEMRCRVHRVAPAHAVA